MHLPILISLLLPVSAAAAGGADPAAVAREMLSCAHHHVQASLMYGDHAITERAAREGSVYIDAAVRATSQEFVDRELPIIGEQVRREFVDGLKDDGDAAAMIKPVVEREYACAASLGEAAANFILPPKPPVPSPYAGIMKTVAMGTPRADLIARLGPPDSSIESPDGKYENVTFNEKADDAAAAPDGPASRALDSCTFTLLDGKVDFTFCRSEASR